MSAIYPSINDSEFDLYKKWAWNFYEYAVNRGITGLTPPNWNDTVNVLLKKITYYTAACVDS